MKHRVDHVYFSVRGSGQFPYDMLRYDRCFPATEADSSQMNERGQRTVNLRAHSIDYDNRAPTEARWESFMWRVTEVVR